MSALQDDKCISLTSSLLSLDRHSLHKLESIALASTRRAIKLVRASHILYHRLLDAGMLGQAPHGQMRPAENNHNKLSRDTRQGIKDTHRDFNTEHTASGSTFRPEDWMGPMPGDGISWDPLCADYVCDFGVRAYCVYVTKREVELLTTIAADQRSSKTYRHFGVRYLKIRPDYCTEQEGFFILSHSVYTRYEGPGTLTPEFCLLKDPTGETALRKYSLVICFYFEEMVITPESRYTGHQAQRRIVDFVKSLLGRPHPAVRARALLECMNDCENIIR